MLTDTERSLILSVFPDIESKDKTTLKTPQELHGIAFRKALRHFAVPCPRCGGSGSYAQSVAYTEVDSGVCHKCFGRGKVLPRLTAKKLEEIKLDYILVGKYEGSAVVSGDVNYDSAKQKVKSKSEQTVLVSITRGAYRARCRNVGKGYQQYDFLIDAIIKELFMIEFATTNSQSVMQGWTNGENTAALVTGHTDFIKTASGSWNKNHTEDCATCNTDGKHACKYRGIENPFGNVWKWCDGINFDTEKIYVCEDPEFYADDKHDAPYTYMGDRTLSEGYAKEIKPFAKQPLLGYTSAVGAGSTTYYCDYHYTNNGAGTVLFCGGDWVRGAAAGLWYWYGSYAASSAYSYIGGRLCYKPL